MDPFLLDDTQFVGNYLAYNIEHATDFIFTLRKLLPKTIFILYTSVASLEFYGSQIFRGPRARLSHYYVLDDGRPRLPTLEEEPYIELDYQSGRNSGRFGLIGSSKEELPLRKFAARVRQLLNICQADLKATLSESELSHIQWWTYVHEGATKVQDAQLLRPDATTVRADMFSAISSLAGKVFLPNRDQVFLSYAFDNESLAAEMSMLLESKGFSVVSGRQSRKYISDDRP